MHSADYAVARCPSVCPSVTHQYSVKTAKHIIILFFILGYPHHSIFFTSVGKAILQRGLP